MHEEQPIDRRGFLQAGVAASAVAALASASGTARGADDPKPNGNKDVLPKRTLGKTGVEVTLLNQGTVGQPDALDRLLRSAYREGVRYFDTAEGYKNSEKVIGELARRRRPRSARRSSWPPRATSARRATCSRSSTSGSPTSRPTTSTSSSSTGSIPARPTGPRARS